MSACGGSKTTEVDVTLTDFGIKSSLTTFQTGVPYHFVVTNKGAVVHEFMIVPPQTAGTASSEELDKIAIGHIEESDLQSGVTKTVAVTFTEPFPAGTLEMACHLPGHYEAGMKLPIIVQ